MSGNSFVRRMMALGGLVREKVRNALHHGVKRAIAVVRSGFEYDMGLVADGFTSDPSKTEEENEAACLGLIEATEEPGGRLTRLFKDEVLPLADVLDAFDLETARGGRPSHRGSVLASPCRGPWRGTAAPRSVARQRLPRQRPRPRAGPRHRARRAPMHGAAALVRRAVSLCAAKSVSFFIKKSVSNLKIVLKKC
jgi:hypothetical protein